MIEREEGIKPNIFRTFRTLRTSSLRFVATSGRMFLTVSPIRDSVGEFVSKHLKSYTVRKK